MRGAFDNQFLKTKIMWEKEKAKFIKEFKEIGHLKTKAKFKCYSDHVFSYGFEKRGEYHEINFICDDTILNKMTVEDIINLDRVEYFQHCIYYIQICNEIGENDGRKEYERIGSMSFCKRAFDVALN